NPGLLGTPAQFRERFVLPVEKMNDHRRGQLLREMIRPFVLRRTKQDPEVAVNLPAKMEMRVFTSLTPEQAAMYERITSQMLAGVENASGIRRRGLILAGLTRLKQICDHPALITDDKSIDHRSGKCERLVEMLEEVLAADDAALIFTQYREMGVILEKVIRTKLHVEPLFLHGGVPVKDRDTMIQEFQRPGTPHRIFLLSLRAGGLGLNLTAANHVFHFDRWWNPAVEAQATDRAHRIGQNKVVQVHKFVSIGTVEERIDKLLAEKTALADNIVTSGDQWLTNMSTEDLRSYLSLSSGAIEDSVADEAEDAEDDQQVEAARES
ncbi:MAG TPA: DEAD/DEAH box helicase, partial [Tepidisphaeraceae bacterium]